MAIVESGTEEKPPVDKDEMDELEEEEGEDEARNCGEREEERELEGEGECNLKLYWGRRASRRV